MAALEIAGSALLVLPEADANAYRSGRNIARCEVRIASEVNAYDVLRAGTVILVGDALQRIQERVA